MDIATSRPSSSSSSSSPKSLRDRLTSFPSFPRLRNRLWTEETLPIRNNRPLPQPQLPSSSPVPMETTVRVQSRTANPFAKEPEPGAMNFSALLPEDGEDYHDDDVESTSDVSTLSNVSQHLNKVPWNDQGGVDEMEMHLPPLPREIEFHTNADDDEDVPEWLLMSLRSAGIDEEDEQEISEPCESAPPLPPDSSRLHLFLPPLNTSEPSSAIPRPTLGKHCKSAPAAATLHPSLRVDRPISLTAHHRTRTTWGQLGAMSSVAGVSSPSLLSQDTPSSFILGNRERYRQGSSSRSVATLSVGSLVGQSSWVTAPELTTATTSSHIRTATTSTSNSSLASELELGPIPEGASSRKPRSRRRRVCGDDIKRMLLLRHIRLPLRTSSSRSPEEAVTLHRSSGCLT